MAHGLNRRLLWLCVPALALVLGGCWTRAVKDVVQDKEGLKVILRSQTRAGTPVPMGYQHPASISGVRLANVLSQIEIRTADEDEKARKPAFEAELLFEVGDALAGALAKATPDQDIAVLATRRTRRLGIFNEDFLTSFTAYVKNDRLVIVLSRVDWPIPKDSKDDRLPEPNPEKPVMKFRVIPTEGMTNLGPQGVAVDWRASQFKAGSNVTVTPGGKVMRRTILMESVQEDPGARDDESVPTIPASLSPETLRKLADLEEARRRGELSEAEYASQKNAILRADHGATPARHPASTDE